jgi:hypothetical protein
MYLPWLEAFQSPAQILKEMWICRVRDERKMAFLFQYFVYNFLRLERSDLNVRRENIPWKMDFLPNGNCSLLPQMQTDISITTSARKMAEEGQVSVPFSELTLR